MLNGRKTIERLAEEYPQLYLIPGEDGAEQAYRNAALRGIFSDPAPGRKAEQIVELISRVSGMAGDPGIRTALFLDKCIFMLSCVKSTSQMKIMCYNSFC